MTIARYHSSLRSPLAALRARRLLWIAGALAAAGVWLTTGAAPASAACYDGGYQAGRTQLPHLYEIRNSLCIEPGPPAADGTPQRRVWAATNVYTPQDPAIKCQASVSAFLGATRYHAESDLKVDVPYIPRTRIACHATVSMLIPRVGMQIIDDEWAGWTSTVTAFANSLIKVSPSEKRLGRSRLVSTADRLPDGSKRYPQGTRAIIGLTPSDIEP